METPAVGAAEVKQAVGFLREPFSRQGVAVDLEGQTETPRTEGVGQADGTDERRHALEHRAMRPVLNPLDATQQHLVAFAPGHARDRRAGTETRRQQRHQGVAQLGIVTHHLVAFFVHVEVAVARSQQLSAEGDGGPQHFEFIEGVGAGGEQVGQRIAVLSPQGGEVALHRLDDARRQ